MKKRVLGATIAALLGNVSLADTFQAEAGLLFTNSQIDAIGADIDTLTIGGALYFNPVDDSKGPLLEATFLDRASGVAATWSDPDSPVDEFYSIDGRVVTASGLIVEAGYSDRFNDDTYNIGFGTYLSDNSSVVVGYTTRDDADFDVLDATYHAVRKLAGTASLAYNVNAGYVDTNDSGYTFGGDVTWYLNPQLGFGAMASFADFNNTEIQTFGVQASYFFAPTFYVEGFVRTSDYDGPDEDTYGLGASLRF